MPPCMPPRTPAYIPGKMLENKRRAAKSQRAEMERSIEKTSTRQRANGQLVEVMSPPGYLLLQMAKLFAGVV